MQFDIEGLIDEVHSFNTRVYSEFYASTTEGHSSEVDKWGAQLENHVRRIVRTRGIHS